MIRRRTRKPLMPAQEKLRADADRAHLKSRILAAGAAEQLQQCYDVADFELVASFIATELRAAFEEDRRARDAFYATNTSSRVTSRPNPKRKRK